MLPTSNWYFEDIVLGHTLQSATHRVSQEDVLAFGRLTRDETPLHTDPGFARTTQFGGCIAHGLYGLALIEGLKSLSGLFDQSAVASLSWNRVQFRRPIFPGDEVFARWTYTRANEHPNGNQGVVMEETALLNQRNEVVISAVHTFIVKRRDMPATSRRTEAGE